MSVSDIVNFIRIDDRIATAGQPTPAQFRDARDEGYEGVINLAPDGMEGSLPNEAGLLRSLGLEYHHIPVVWTHPLPSQFDEFEAAMSAMAERRILIHCQANYRVTVFFGLYAAARLGWKDADADALIDRIWTARSGYEMDDVWKGFIATQRQRL